jgi:UbiD family decarboxylase
MYMSLKRFVELLHEEVIDITNKVLGRDLEPTHYLAEADNNMKMVLFRVVDSPYLCVGNVLNSRRRLYRHVLGVETDIDAYRKVLSLTPVKPREISFEEKYEVLTEIDLEKVPFIKFYPRDGGRYLSSSIYIACLDNVCNASIHRTMIVSKDSVVARIVPRHLRYIYDNYMRKGIREVPVAIVVGSHPATLLCAAISPPFGVFELELVPQLFKDFTITYTPRYSLPIPSDAALVLEGRITDITVPEGPFVDLLHLYDSVRNEPLIKIDAMYVNYDEYFNIILPAGKEHKLLQSFYREALIWDYVSRVVPKVHKVRLLESSGSWLVAAVAIEKTHDADAKNAVLASFAAHPSLKMVMVLDPDVDIDSESRLLWALATRFRGRDSLILVERARCSTLDPSSPTGVCDKVGFDLTIPLSEDRSRYSYVEVR